MQRKVILFNAPPRAGKDSAAEAVMKTGADATKVKFSDPVKKGTHASYELDVDVDHFEDVKDEPREEFLGLTPRQAYIEHSERYMKPIHGKDVFGKLAARRMGKTFASTILVPDSGFVDEAIPVVDQYGADNVLLVQIYREGCSFDRDSRSYLDEFHLGVPRVALINDGTLDDLADKTRGIVRNFLTQ